MDPSAILTSSSVPSDSRRRHGLAATVRKLNFFRRTYSFIFGLSFSFFARRPVPQAQGQRKKTETRARTYSPAKRIAVPSAREGLTAGFGMGPGGPPPLLSPVSLFYPTSAAVMDASASGAKAKSFRFSSLFLSLLFASSCFFGSSSSFRSSSLETARN